MTVYFFGGYLAFSTPTLPALSAEKAPNGYGLGGYATWITAAGTNLNDVVANGWYVFNSANNANSPFGTGTMLVLNRGADGQFVHQIAFQDDNSAMVIKVRKRVGGTWSGWIDWTPTSFAPAGYKKLLWTNPYPSSTFAAQKVSLDLSEYQQVEIHTLLNGDMSGLGFSHVLNVGTTYYYNMNGYYDVIEWRSARASTTGVEFLGSYRAGTARDDRIIPYKIYGIKGVQ